MNAVRLQGHGFQVELPLPMGLLLSYLFQLLLVRLSRKFNNNNNNDDDYYYYYLLLVVRFKPRTSCTRRRYSISDLILQLLPFSLYLDLTGLLKLDLGSFCSSGRPSALDASVSIWNYNTPVTSGFVNSGLLLHMKTAFESFSHENHFFFFFFF